MKLPFILKRLSLSPLRTASLGSAMAASLVLVACGGGGGGTPLAPEAVVTSVASAQVLEGDAQASLLEFVVTLNKPVERSLVVTYSTSSTDKPTGYAKAGGACGAGIDYIAITSQPVTIAPGSSTGKLTVTVCPDGVFESNESLKLTWSSLGAPGGTVEGTIINDDAGGLNGTGSTALLSGLTAFGRDTHALTNASADGALGFSFDKSGACVVDKVTGLIWQKSFTPNKVYADLGAYVTSVNGPTLCGRNDWRVPTGNELLNLMDASKTSGITANADYLGVAADAMAGMYWSSEVNAASPTIDAWQVDADSNGVISVDGQNVAKNVRLVSGTPLGAACSNSDNRFTDHLDGTVSDARTGLMWKQCREGYAGNACTTTTGSVSIFGSTASVVAQLNNANIAADKGYSDWRVPTRNELASLVNRACTNSAIVAVFPANDPFAYITSSLSSNAPATEVWSVDFANGNVRPDLLSRNYYLRLVRAGQ